MGQSSSLFCLKTCLKTNRYVGLPVRHKGDVIFWGLISLLAVRIACSLIGFDRMPLVPALGDEAFINDPAVTRGGR
jgi:hypothetical protein